MGSIYFLYKNTAVIADIINPKALPKTAPIAYIPKYTKIHAKTMVDTCSAILL